MSKADKSPRRTAPNDAIYDKLALVLKVSERLKDPSPPSLRAIAAELETTDYFIRSAFKGVSQLLGGVTLINTAEKTASATTLTEEGRVYLDRIARVLAKRPNVEPEIRLAVSHSLLSSGLLTPALARFQFPGPGAERKQRVILTANVEMDFDRIVRDLQQGQLDAAVVFASPQRAERTYPGIDKKELSPKFDVVLIGTNQKDVERLALQPQALSRYRVAAMKDERQPAAGSIPQPHYGEGGERIDLDTIDAVIHAVHARVADFGIIVANYGFLEPMRLAGQLYSEPLAGNPKAQLLALWKSPSPRPDALLLMNFIDVALSNTPNLVNKPASVGSPEFPTSWEWYEKLCWGYFIEQDRTPGIDPSNNIPKWLWEEVKLKYVPNGDNQEQTNRKLRFEGHIRNQLQDEFDCDGQLINNLFFIHAWTSQPQLNRHSVVEFISVFTLCDEHQGILVGHWTGRDARDNQPAVFGTVWSHSKLSPERLREISDTARARTMLCTDQTLDFSSHPEFSTL